MIHSDTTRTHTVHIELIYSDALTGQREGGTPLLDLASDGVGDPACVLSLISLCCGVNEEAAVF